MTNPNSDSIQGIYENVIGASNREVTLRYWAELGYQPVQEGRLSAEQARALYSVDSALGSVRLQNGAVNTHGLVRLMLWEKPPVPGLGLVRPLTVGGRWLTARTSDIMRLRDAYMDAVTQGEEWVVSELIRNIIREGKEGAGFYERFVGVREMMVLGQETRQVYFQRYGYDVPGYGTIADTSPLGVSESTHMGIVVPDLSQLDFYSEVLGLKLENRHEVLPAQPDTRPDVTMSGNTAAIHPLMRREGETYSFVTFVTPRANVGRMYVVAPQDKQPDMRDHSRPGVTGLCLSTYLVSNLEEYRVRISASTATAVTPINANEFGEPSFSFTAPDGTAWALVGKS